MAAGFALCPERRIRKSAEAPLRRNGAGVESTYGTVGHSVAERLDQTGSGTAAPDPTKWSGGYFFLPAAASA